MPRDAILAESGERDKARQYALLEPLHFAAEISIGMEKLR
jgi:hypothetical protein